MIKNSYIFYFDLYKHYTTIYGSIQRKITLMSKISSIKHNRSKVRYYTFMYLMEVKYGQFVF